MTSSALIVQGLCQFTRDQQVLFDVSFELPAGETLGLIGGKACGKTPLLRTLAALSLPARGTVRVLEHDLSEQALPVRRKIGYVPTQTAGHATLSVSEYLEFFAETYANPEAEAVRLGLELVGLTARAQTALGRLSELERRRVHLARALLADPELLLIDQPDSDPSDPERKSSETELHEILRDLSGLGKTVVIAAARWSEVASLCSQRLNLDRGRVTGSHKTGATQQLSLFPRSGPSVAPSAGKRLKLWTEQPTPILVELLRRQPQVLDVETLADGSHVIHHNGDDAFMPDLLRRLIGAGIDVKGLENVNLPQAAVSSERDDKGNA